MSQSVLAFETGSDLIGRLRQLIEVGGGAALILGGLFIAILLVLTVMNRRKALLAIFVLALMFSGHPMAALNAGSTLLRWLVMFMLAMTVAFGISNPGLPAILLSLFSFGAIFGAFNVPTPFYGIQRGGLMLILTCPMAIAIANSIRTREDIRQLIRLYVIAAVVYFIMSLIALPSIRQGGRFGGMAGGMAAPLYVLTGGALLPFVLFYSFRAHRKWGRILGALLTFGIFGFLLLSGQRTGTFAGIIACIPILTRFGLRRVFYSLLILILLAGAFWGVLSLFPQQAEFITSRFLSARLTGREEGYLWGLQIAREGSFFGMGFGAASFHNAYILAWVTAGPLGLVLFSLAYLVLAYQSVALFFKALDTEMRDMARLFVGFSLGFIAAGFFEGVICSPSNVASTTCVLVSVMCARLLKICKEEQALGGADWPIETAYGVEPDVMSHAAYPPNA